MFLLLNVLSALNLTIFFFDENVKKAQMRQFGAAAFINTSALQH